MRLRWTETARRAGHSNAAIASAAGLTEKTIAELFAEHDQEAREAEKLARMKAALRG